MTRPLTTGSTASLIDLLAQVAAHAPDDPRWPGLTHKGRALVVIRAAANLVPEGHVQSRLLREALRERAGRAEQRHREEHEGLLARARRVTLPEVERIVREAVETGSREADLILVMQPAVHDLLSVETYTQAQRDETTGVPVLHAIAERVERLPSSATSGGDETVETRFPVPVITRLFGVEVRRATRDDAQKPPCVVLDVREAREEAQAAFRAQNAQAGRLEAEGEPAGDHSQGPAWRGEGDAPPHAPGFVRVAGTRPEGVVEVRGDLLDHGDGVAHSGMCEATDDDGNPTHAVAATRAFENEDTGEVINVCDSCRPIGDEWALLVPKTLPGGG